MTEIVELPIGWGQATIEDIISGDGIFVDGDWIESKDQDPNGEVRLIQLADIGDGNFKDKSKRFLTYQKALELNCTFLKENDILLARMPDPIGRACIFPLKGENKFITAVDVAIIRLGKNSIQSKFLVHSINNRTIRNEIEKLQSGTTRKRISRTNLGTVEFPIPPLPEQHRIVAKIEELFSSLDKGIENLKTAQAQLKIYRQAVLRWAFEGKFTNKNVKDGELPEGWKVYCMNDIISILTDYHANGSYQNLKKNVELKEIKDYAAMIRATNFEKNSFTSDLKYISEDAYNFLSKSKIFGGEILIGKIGNAGKVYLMPKLKFPCSLAMNLFLIRTNELTTNKFIYYQLISEKCSKQIKKLVKGDNPTIDKKAIRSIIIVTPPTLAEQDRIVSEIEARLSICDKLEESMTQTLAQAEALRQSILKKAFEGRLIPQDPNDEPASVLLERIRVEQERNRPQRQLAITRRRKVKNADLGKIPERERV